MKKYIIIFICAALLLSGCQINRDTASSENPSSSEEVSSYRIGETTLNSKLFTPIKMIQTMFGAPEGVYMGHSGKSSCGTEGNKKVYSDWIKNLKGDDIEEIYGEAVPVSEYTPGEMTMEDSQKVFDNLKVMADNLQIMNEEELRDPPTGGGCSVTIHTKDRSAHISYNGWWLTVSLSDQDEKWVFSVKETPAQKSGDEIDDILRANMNNAVNSKLSVPVKVLMGEDIPDEYTWESELLLSTEEDKKIYCDWIKNLDEKDVDFICGDSMPVDYYVPNEMTMEDSQRIFDILKEMADYIQPKTERSNPPTGGGCGVLIHTKDRTASIGFNGEWLTVSLSDQPNGWIFWADDNPANELAAEMECMLYDYMDGVRGGDVVQSDNSVYVWSDSSKPEDTVVDEDPLGLFAESLPKDLYAGMYLGKQGNTYMMVTDIQKAIDFMEEEGFEITVNFKKAEYSMADLEKARDNLFNSAVKFNIQMVAVDPETNGLAVFTSDLSNENKNKITDNVEKFISETFPGKSAKMNVAVYDNNKSDVHPTTNTPVTPPVNNTNPPVVDTTPKYEYDQLSIPIKMVASWELPDYIFQGNGKTNFDTGEKEKIIYLDWINNLRGGDINTIYGESVPAFEYTPGEMSLSDSQKVFDLLKSITDIRLMDPTDSRKPNPPTGGGWDITIHTKDRNAVIGYNGAWLVVNFSDQAEGWVFDLEKTSSHESAEKIDDLLGENMNNGTVPDAFYKGSKVKNIYAVDTNKYVMAEITGENNIDARYTVKLLNNYTPDGSNEDGLAYLIFTENGKEYVYLDQSDPDNLNHYCKSTIVNSKALHPSWLIHMSPERIVKCGNVTDKKKLLELAEFLKKEVTVQPETNTIPAAPNFETGTDGGFKDGYFFFKIKFDSGTSYQISGTDYGDGTGDLYIYTSDLRYTVSYILDIGVAQKLTKFLSTFYK